MDGDQHPPHTINQDPERQPESQALPKGAKGDLVSPLSPPVAHLQKRDLLRNPLTFFLTLVRQYGDVVCYRPAPEPAYLVNHPDLIRHVLVDNSRNYTKDTYINQMFKRAVADGLLTSEGEAWRRQRRLMQPAFHHHRLKQLDRVITERTKLMLERWDHAYQRGESILISQEMATLTLSITTKILFGIDLGEEVQRIGMAVDMGGALLERPNHPRFREGLQIIEEIVDRIIAMRRNTKTGESDLLSLLLEAQDPQNGSGLQDHEVRHQTVTLLLAGYETTASALTWTWYLLAQHPEATEQLRQEAQTFLNGHIPQYADLENLPYARMVFEEALRLYPPAWILGRRAVAEDRLGDYTIPANAIVAISPYTIHRHPTFWEEPERFDPLRFSKERSASRHRFAYIPFGAGPRQCIGNHLALLEAGLILPMIAQHFVLTLDDDHPISPEVVFVLRPDRQMRMRLIKP